MVAACGAANGPWRRQPVQSVNCGCIRVSAGRCGIGDKNNSFLQKQSLTHSFYGFPPPLTFLDPDRWVQCEGYGGPNLGEKIFQLFSIFTV